MAPQYVLYINAHGREQYVARWRDNTLEHTEDLRRALRFDTAREAYDFGGDHSLSNARAGIRV